MTVMNDLARTPPSDQPSERPARQRKPDWIRVRAPVSEGYHETRRLMRELNLNTVCEEAACPNIGESWTKKHATVMILGDVREVGEVAERAHHGHGLVARQRVQHGLQRLPRPRLLDAPTRHGEAADALLEDAAADMFAEALGE